MKDKAVPGEGGKAWTVVGGRWSVTAVVSNRPPTTDHRPRLTSLTGAKRPGFTLVEVLVVMIILAILAAVVVPRVVGRTEDARRARAVADIESLGTALDLFKADVGEYPTTEQGLQALRQSPGDVKNWNGPYLKKPLGADPWGNEYIYIAPGEQNADSYDLSSLGADGQPGGEGKDADVTNWEEG